MRIGKLRHRLQIQSMTGTKRTEQGGVTPDWKTDATVWGEVKPLTGGEVFRALQVGARATHQVTMRYDVDLTPAMRILHRTRVLNIESALNQDERRHEQIVLCREIVTGH